MRSKASMIQATLEAEGLRMRFGFVVINFFVSPIKVDFVVAITCRPVSAILSRQVAEAEFLHL